MKEEWEWFDEAGPTYTSDGASIYNLELFNARAELYLKLAMMAIIMLAVYLAVKVEDLPTPVWVLIGAALAGDLYLMFGGALVQKTIIELGDKNMIVKGKRELNISFSNISSYKINDDGIVRLRISQNNGPMIDLMANLTPDDKLELTRLITDFKAKVVIAIDSNQSQAVRNPTFFERPYALPLMNVFTILILMMMAYPIVTGSFDAHILGTGIFVLGALWGRYRIFQSNRE